MVLQSPAPLRRIHRRTLIPEMSLVDQSRERTRGSLTSDTCLIEYMYICIHVQVAWIVLDTCTFG